MTTPQPADILTATTGVGSLVGAFRAHVRGRVLPAPAVLSFAANEISVQPEGALDLARQLGNILVWASTLSDVTAKWWRTDGDGLHISVRGRTLSGTCLRVYGGGHFAECLGLVQLAPEEADGVSVDELYHFLGQLQDAQHEREVA
jgi:hypothetical protein